MFTGIVEARGIVSNKISKAGDVSINVDAGRLGKGKVRVGDSVAVSGVCLTVVRVNKMCLGFDVSRETLDRTCLGDLIEGAKVNLELAVAADGRFGGHFVTGHIDGIGKLEASQISARSIEMTFRCDNELAPYLAEKGSICVDGISLTINEVIDDSDCVRFLVNIIPHTLEVTTFGNLQVGDRVHLEIDSVARYVKRLRDWDQYGLREP